MCVVEIRDNKRSDCEEASRNQSKADGLLIRGYKLLASKNRRGPYKKSKKRLWAAIEKREFWFCDKFFRNPRSQKEDPPERIREGGGQRDKKVQNCR